MSSPSSLSLNAARQRHSPDGFIREHLVRDCQSAAVWISPFAHRLMQAVLPLVLLTAAASQVAWGQGGGIANSVGISIENSANAANNQNAANAANANRSPNTNTPPPSIRDTSSEEIEMEYDDDGEYEMESDDGTGYGGRGGARRGGANANVIAMGGSLLADSMAEFFNRPLPESATQFKPTLYEQAALALHQGDQRLALTVYHAHLIAERSSASAALDSVVYSSLLRRPVWALRLGISINAKVPPDMADDPQPIREGDQPATGRGRVAGGRGGQYNSVEDYGDGSQPSPRRGAPRGESPEEEMDESSGFEEDSEDSEDYEDYARQPKQEIVPTTPGGAGTIMADETLDRYLGLVADVLKAELTQRISDGQFGSALVELAPHGEELITQAAPSVAAAMGQSGDSVAMWIPGVDFLGTGLFPDLLAKAKLNEVDVLFHCEILVKETRVGDPQYSLRCRVVNVATGETLGASKLMDKRDVLLAARRSSAKVVVEEMLRPAWDAVDSKAVVQPLPQLAPQHAMSRIDLLLASQQSSRMQHLAEISMFHRRGLIDEDQLEQAVYFAAGEDGLRLLYAEQEERDELVRSFVLKELGQE